MMSFGAFVHRTLDLVSRNKKSGLDAADVYATLAPWPDAAGAERFLNSLHACHAEKLNPGEAAKRFIAIWHEVIGDENVV